MTAPNPGEPVYGLYIEEYTPIGSSKAGRRQGGGAGGYSTIQSRLRRRFCTLLGRTPLRVRGQEEKGDGAAASQSAQSISQSVSQRGLEAVWGVASQAAAKGRSDELIPGGGRAS